MMSRRRSAAPGLLASALVLLLIGCDDSTPAPPQVGEDELHPGHSLLEAGASVTLTAEADAFVPGGDVVLVLENHTGEPVGYNLCFHGLEQRSGDDWELLDFGFLDPDRACITVLYTLESGEAVEYETTLPDAMPPGEYRFRVALYLLETEVHRDQVSNAFSVGW